MGAVRRPLGFGADGLPSVAPGQPGGCSLETVSRVPGLVWAARAGTPSVLTWPWAPGSILQGVHGPGFCCDAPASRHR